MIAYQPPLAICQVPGCAWQFRSENPEVLRLAIVAHVSTHMGAAEGWTVRVWNGQARLARIVPRDAGDYAVEDVDLRRFSPSLRARVRTLLLESVRQAGGGLTQSGFYPPTPELVDLLRQHGARRARGRAWATSITLYPEDRRALDRLRTLLGVQEASLAIRTALRLALRALGDAR